MKANSNWNTLRHISMYARIILYAFDMLTIKIASNIKLLSSISQRRRRACRSTENIIQSRLSSKLSAAAAGAAFAGRTVANWFLIENEI